MTRLGAGAGLLGATLMVIGWLAVWPPVAVLGTGAVVLLAGALVHTAMRPRLDLSRDIAPARVEKGSPALAVVHATNRSRRTLPGLVIEQRVGDAPVSARLPRLRRGESGVRTYRLPTSRRGLFEIGPVELPRADPFGLCRRVQQLGAPQQIAVHPRVVGVRPLPTGASRNLEGPSSDLSPQGTTTSHRLREYAEGDDLRTVHWPTTARLGRLVVRHNVDTAQPYSVVLLDLRPSVYSEETFEAAVDAAASVVVALAGGRAPVQLRTTAGVRLGGRAHRDPAALVDHLTTVVPSEAGGLLPELLLLRRDRGGTALVVVTGRLGGDSLPAVAGLRRRFDRVVAVSVRSRPAELPAYSGVTILGIRDLDELPLAWNSRVRR